MAIGSDTRDVQVTIEGLALPGLSTVPPAACGLVIFAHGSGSSRMSSRNQVVARWLVERGCGTLLFDLLTEDEAADRRNVFDIPLLGRRVMEAVKWAGGQPDTAERPIGLFGASTGAAAALIAAAELGPAIAAVVSRGGRPDLAIPVLPQVVSPTLLIVGSRDDTVLELNREAQGHLRCEHRLAIVDGATHLFAEIGTLEQAAGHAGDWFLAQFNRP